MAATTKRGSRTTKIKQNLAKKHKNDKKKVERKTAVGGHMGAAEELKQAGTIYMLGGDPIYVHTYVRHVKVGMNTANAILQQGLKKIVDQVHDQIREYIIILKNKEKQLLKVTGHKTIEEFTQWWNTDVTTWKSMKELRSTKPEDKDEIYYVNLLQRIKDTRLLVYAYNKLRNDWNKAQSQASRDQIAEQLLPFMGVTISRSGQKAPPGSLTSDLYDAWRWLKEEIKTVKTSITWDKVYQKQIDQWISNIQAGERGNKQVPTDIGKFFELLDSRIEKKVKTNANKMITIASDLVAAEDSSKLTYNTGYKTNVFKGDTRKTISNGEISFSFIVSDKTGADYAFEQTNRNEMSILRTYTSAVNSDTLNLSNITTSVAIDPDLQNTIYYVAANSKDFMPLSSTKVRMNKELIVSIFTWSKLLVELINWVDDPKDWNLFIQNFDQIVPTRKVLEGFLTLYGTCILEQMVDKYLNNWYRFNTAVTAVVDEQASSAVQEKQKKQREKEEKINENSALARDKLYLAKREALTILDEKGIPVSYDLLKEMIVDTLDEAYELIKERFSFNTTQKITLGNSKSLVSGWVNSKKMF